MTRKERLIEALNNACYDWEGDFFFTVTSTEEWKGTEHFDVEISARFLRIDISFAAKVEPRSGEDIVEMEYSEDNWYAIDQENLFTFMFFELAQQHTPEGYRNECGGR